MANILKVDQINTIRTLSKRGWSHRRIARELGINRKTVAAHLSEGSDSKRAISTAGRQSLCVECSSVIEGKIEAGLEAQRIHQDLVSELGFTGSYESVKRFVRKLRQSDPKRVWRMECEPGEEAQIDFGLGAPVLTDGRRKRTWVFRVILSFSRKGYSEAVLSQDTESFIRCLENALRYFGGVPAILNPDNLKAAVLQADWHDPQLNPKIEAFCRHYGTTLMPSRPYRPQDKGKVESGIKYVKNNALKGRVFDSLQEQNAFLLDWEKNIADRRIHGTTRKQVGTQFEQHERPALKPLPPSLFPSYSEGLRRVHRDSYIEVKKAYYHVPEEFIGRSVWAQWDGRIVRVFDQRMQQIASHVRLQPGEFSTVLGCAGRKETVEKSLAWWQRRASRIGPHCSAWAKGVAERRGAQGMRVLQGMCSLSRKHTHVALDAACQAALSRESWRLRDIRAILQERTEQNLLPFAEEHELIRPLRQYGALVPFASGYDNHHTKYEL